MAFFRLDSEPILNENVKQFLFFLFSLNTETFLFFKLHSLSLMFCESGQKLLFLCLCCLSLLLFLFFKFFSCKCFKLLDHLSLSLSDFDSHALLILSFEFSFSFSEFLSFICFNPSFFFSYSFNFPLLISFYRSSFRKLSQSCLFFCLIISFYLSKPYILGLNIDSILVFFGKSICLSSLLSFKLFIDSMFLGQDIKSDLLSFF